MGPDAAARPSDDPGPSGPRASDGAPSSGDPYAESARAAEALLTAPGAPFAVVRGESGTLQYATGPRTLREFVETVWAFGDRPFLIAESGTYSYAEFFAAACALARRLTDVHGLRPGDRAVIGMRNHPEWQVAFWAAQLAGLVAVPLNAWWTGEEFAYALDDCAPRVLLVDGERLDRVAGWARTRGVRGMVFHHAGPLPEGFERYADLDELTAPDPAAGPPDVDVPPDADATIIYTSGTTGRSKGAVATQLAQVGAVLNPRFQAAMSMLGRGVVPGQGPAPVTLMTFPFFHVAAFTSVYAAMAAGGTLVLMRKWDAGRALDLIREHRVTHYAGVPATALQLLAAAEESGSEGAALESLTALNTGGAAAPPGLVTGLTARYGSRIEPRNGYGLTETSGGVLANVGAEYRSWPQGAGRATPVTEVRIAGPDGSGLADGEIGELWLRGQSLVRGYWNDPEATRLAFQDGWFRTGDLAVLDSGRVTIVDRIKDMVIRGGENVYCVEVEGVLHDHPAVLDAAVLGVPHPVLGEEVAAVVQVRADAEVSEEELRAHVGAVLAGFKVPARVVVRRGALPRNAAGKVVKGELRGELGAG
ncbi:class I adenylate-forming enzyme family protein [Streptomyces sp. ASQP_92]|uniref:class I adenylate-forming enzyme family protein n=1 Tax=Streptomyces sp. ASQP_92 TaxID=2979116 RepID=UPI0037D9D9FE